MIIFEDSIVLSSIKSFALGAGISALRTRNDTGTHF